MERYLRPDRHLAIRLFWDCFGNILLIFYGHFLAKTNSLFSSCLHLARVFLTECLVLIYADDGARVKKTRRKGEARAIALLYSRILTPIGIYEVIDCLIGLEGLIHLKYDVIAR